MKFIVSKDLRKNRLMRNLLLFFSLIMLLFLALDVVNKALRFGFTFTDIQNSILGNKEEFIEPISMLGALELIHSDMFMAMLLLLLIGAIFMRIETKFKAQQLSSAIMLSIASFVSFFSSMFFGKVFVTVAVVAFLSWHILAMFMLFVSLKWLLTDI